MPAARLILLKAALVINIIIIIIIIGYTFCLGIRKTVFHCHGLVSGSINTEQGSSSLLYSKHVSSAALCLA